MLFISDVLSQQPQLFARIEYYVERRSQFGLGDSQFLGILLSALFKLRFWISFS